MVWRCGAETSGVLGVFVNPSDNFHHTYAILWEESMFVIILHTFVRLEYFLQLRMTWFMHGPWEPGRVSSSRQHPRAGSWPGWWSCRILARMVEQPREKILVIAMVTSPPPLSSQAGCGFPGRQVPEFIFPVIFPPSSSHQSHLTTAAATHLLSTTIHHHHGRIRQSSAKWC